MKKLFVLIVALGVLAPTLAMANEHKCDCKAKEHTEECKKECEHHAEHK